MIEYVKWGKRDKEEIPDVGTSGERKEANKCKHSYIATITRRAPHAKIPSKGNMIRNIVEMLVTHKRTERHQ